MTDSKDDPWVIFKNQTKPLKRNQIFHECFVYHPPRVLVRDNFIFERPMGTDSVVLEPTRKKRRKVMPEGVIDLHGMTQDQAYENLIRFIRFSLQHNRRVVLVITGKGTVSKKGILRSALCSWLQVEPLKAWVRESSSARLEHGGEGAFYLVLKNIANSL